PHEFGLHHLNFLIRRNLDWRSVLFGHEWWHEMYHGSKRDQMSFDFVRWKLPQVRVKTLDISYNENDMFTCDGKHRLPQRIISEKTVVPYEPGYELWPHDSRNDRSITINESPTEFTSAFL